MPLFQNKLAGLKVAKSKDGKLLNVGFDVSEDFAEDGSKGDGNVCEFLSILFFKNLLCLYSKITDELHDVPSLYEPWLYYREIQFNSVVI